MALAPKTNGEQGIDIIPIEKRSDTARSNSATKRLLLRKEF
jgi:hypothetical protein